MYTLVLVMKKLIKSIFWNLVILFSLTLLFYEIGEAQGQKGTEECLECHRDKALSTTLANGTEINLYIDPIAFAESVHGQNIRCIDCHRDITECPHPERQYKNRRDYTIAYYESCKHCHFDNYTKTLDSVHYKLFSEGDSRAPVCVDCHGSHYITRPEIPRTKISETCARCHREINAAYKASVHGKALTEEANLDVPVCTDCHRSHNIEDPRTASFILKTPELCGTCHTNERLMQKYGLSTGVLKTYLTDFHGMTSAFYRQEKGKISVFTAVCIDCHGVHDITKTDAPNSPVMQANLVNTCRKCHPDATANFPAAWMSHYEPSFKKFPLVYLVKLFYRIFIPFIIGGIVLQVFLHVWRMAINR